MPVFVFLNPTITINAVDMSGMAKQAKLVIEVDEKETTAFSTSTVPSRTRVGGLRDWTLDLDFNQDFGIGQVNATLFSLIGTVVPLELRNQTGAASSTNPTFRGNVLVGNYMVADGNVGDLAHSSVTWHGSGSLFQHTT